MTRMYLMTEQQHAQIVDALNLPSLKTVSMLIERDAALAMLKAMQSVSPVATMHENISSVWFTKGLDDHEYDNTIVVTPLYTPEAK